MNNKEELTTILGNSDLFPDFTNRVELVLLTDDEWNTILRALCSPDPDTGPGPDFHSKRCAELYEKIKKARSSSKESPPPPPREIIPRPQFLQKDGEDALKQAMKRSPGNPFVEGCTAFLAERGFLSAAQIESLKRVYRDAHLRPPPDTRSTVYEVYEATKQRQATDEDWCPMAAPRCRCPKNLFFEPPDDGD
jgi:hypothetical protein